MAESTITARCTVLTSSGKAQLITAARQFRGGDLKLSIQCGQMPKVTVRGGTLSVTCPDGVATFDLGAAAPKWADKILHPPSRLQKIGVKPQWRVSAIGVADTEFLQELEGGVALLSVGRVLKASDAIFHCLPRGARRAG